MGIVEAIKNGFGKASKLVNVILVFFVFNTVIGLISLPLSNPDRAGSPAVMIISIISSVVFFLIFVFLQGGAMGLVKDQIKKSSASLADFTDYGRKFYVRILGLLALYILIAIGIVLVLSLLSAGILLLGDNLVTRSIVATIVTVAAIVIITMMVYPIYAIVVDDVSTIDAFKKGILSAKTHFRNTLGLFLSLFVISVFISLVVGFILGMIMVPLNANLGQVIIAIVNALVQSYLPVVMMVSFMSFYMSLDKNVNIQSAGEGA